VGVWIVGVIVLLMAVATAAWSLLGLRRYVVGLRAERSTGPKPFVAPADLVASTSESVSDFGPPPGPRLNSPSRFIAVLVCVLGVPSIVILIARLVSGEHISASLIAQVVFTVLLFVTILRCVTVGRPARWR
jgi:hypothetical protein